MKKNRIFLNFLILILFTVFLSVTCKQNVGLGGTVDIERPEGSITYPDAGETPIRGSFVMRGTAYDDEEVSSVSVVFKNKKTGFKSRAFDGKLTPTGGGSVNWEIEVKNEFIDTEEGHPLVKLYTIPDGEYEATVTITDRNGKTTTLNKTYKIDNTPPVLIIERPSLLASAGDNTPNLPADRYGAVMKIIGSAADMHELTSITLKADKPGSSGPLSITEKTKEKNVNIVMASSPEQNYADLLSVAGGNPTGFDKPLKAVITLQDNARTYNGSDDTAGNESAFYYIKNEIEGLIDLNEYTAQVISDYFSGKTGDEHGTPHEQAIYKLRSGVTVKNDPSKKIIDVLREKMIKPEEKRSVFSLNPDKTPGFKVVSCNPVTVPGSASEPNPILFGTNTVLTVELYPNMDGNSIVSGNNYAASEIKIMLHKGDTLQKLKEKNYEESVTFFDVATDVSSTDIVQQGNIIKITKSLPSNIKPGFYRVEVTGKDVIGNSGFTPYDNRNKPADGLVIITFKVAGAPYVFINNPGRYQKGNFPIKCDVENISGGWVYYNIDSAPSATPPSSSDSHILTLTGGKYTATIDTSSLSEGPHTVHVRAHKSNVVYDVKNISFVFDKMPPKEPVLDPPLDSNVFSKWSHIFKGTVEDVRTTPGGTPITEVSDIEKVTYKVGTQDENNPSSTAPIDYEPNENPAKLIPPVSPSVKYKWEAIVSFSQKTKNYVRVTVYDKAGNETYKDFGPYEVNTDAPQIKFDDIRFSLGSTYTESSPITYVKQNAVIGNGTNANNKKASFKIFAKNAFGIKSVKVTIGSSSKEVSTKTGDAGGYEEWIIPNVDLTEGNPDFKLYVKSKSGTVTEWQTPIIVDFTSPAVTQTYPDLNTVFFKEVKLLGNIIDKPASGNAITSGVDDTTVKYKIGDSNYVTSHIQNGSEWSKIVYLGGAWTIEIPDIAKYQTFGGVTAPQSGERLYSIPIFLQAVDKAGNKVTSSEFKIKFDPTGGTPFAELVSPKNGDALGGDVLISGSAHVADSNSGKSVKKIYLQLGKTQDDLINNVAWNLDGKNYGSNTGVQIYPASGNADVTYWNHILPTAVKNAILGTDNKKEVFLRVKAENSDGLIGDWSSIVNFTINTDVAQFTGMKQLVPNDAVPPIFAEQPYIQNSIWLRGDLFKIKGAVRHSAGIKNDIKVKSPESMPAGYENLDTNGSLGWFNQGNINDNGEIVTSGGLPGYAFTIPIKTSHYIKKAGNIQFEISATDGRTDGFAVPVYYTVLLRYDNSLPSVVFGTAAGKFKKAAFNSTSASGVSVNLQGSENIAQAVTRLKKNMRNLVLFAETKDGSAKAVKISNIEVDGSNAKVTFANTNDFAASADCILIEQNPIIFDKAGSNYQLQGFAYDSGSKTKTLSVKFGDAHMADITGFLAESGNFVSFQHSIETKNINDGKYDLKLNATDNAGNKGNEYSCPIYVRNKPLKINNVSFSTDLNGDNSYSNNAASGLVETVTKDGDDSYIDKVKNYSQTIDMTSEFTIKNAGKSQIKFTLGGGQGARSYKLYKADNSGNQTGQAIKTDVLTNSEINFAAADFGTAANKINDGDNQKFVIVLTDGASESGDTERKLTLKVTLNVKTKDTRKPSAFVAPFYWNGEGKDAAGTPLNSLPDGDRTKGHIEIKKVSSGAGESDVSGQVVLKGTAYHPTKLTRLELTVDGSVKTATNTSGIWSSSDSLEVTDTRLDVNGHWVKWEYTWTTGTPGNNKQILLNAYHRYVAPGSNNNIVSGNTDIGSINGKNALSISSQSLTLKPGDTAVPGQFIRIVGRSGSADEDASYLLPITAVNGSVVEWKGIVVPGNFITYYLYPINEYFDADPSDTDTAKNDPPFNKPAMSVNVVPYVTALKRENRYNTHRSSSGAYNLLRGDKVTVKGFNLTGTVKAAVPGAAEATVSGGTFDLSADAKSGKIKITAGGVEAVNNLTNNSKPYNRQAKAYKPESAYWTDDIEAHVWKDDEQFEGSTNPKFPSMAMGTDGTLYAAFSNYSKSDVYYSKIGTGNASVKTVFHAYDPPEEAAISVTGTDTVNVLYSANYHGGSSNSWAARFTGAGGLYCYDKNANLFNHDSGRLKGKFYRFELFYHNEQLQQFKNFRIVRKDNKIHIAYYDSLANSIKYSTVESSLSPTWHFSDNNHEIAWIDLDGGDDVDSKTDPYLERIGIVGVLRHGAGGQFEDGLERAGGTAEYCAVALDGSGKPVVVYADVDTGTLRLARASSETPTAAANWKVQKVLTEADDPNIGIAEGYFTAKFDSSGYLHIAFRNTRGQLCYVKSKNANAGANAYTFDKSVIIDDAGSLADLSLDGTIPYISYMSKVNAYDGIRIARYDDNLVTEWNDNGTPKKQGAWNIMTAGMKNRASNVRTCIAVAPNNTLGWKAAVGYTPGNKYMVVKYIGE